MNTCACAFHAVAAGEARNIDVVDVSGSNVAHAFAALKNLHAEMVRANRNRDWRTLGELGLRSIEINALLMRTAGERLQAASVQPHLTVLAGRRRGKRPARVPTTPRPALILV